jgi:DNA-binding beta-propeller fold protein YncE
MKSIAEVKHLIAAKAGVRPGRQQLFVVDDQRDDAEDLSLKNHETVQQAIVYSAAGADATDLKLAVMIGLEMAADDFVRMLPPAPPPDLQIGNGSPGAADYQFHSPWGGLAVVPTNPEWIVVCDKNNNRVKIHHAKTGAMLCKYDGSVDDAEEGSADSVERRLSSPMGAVVTNDGLKVLVSDRDNDRVQVLKLVVEEYDAERVALRKRAGYSEEQQLRSVRLEFQNMVGNGNGVLEGMMKRAMGVAMRVNCHGQELVLVADRNNHIVHEFRLDGEFLRVFAGCREPYRAGDKDGELNEPWKVAVLPSGEVAVLERQNHRVQIFDGETGSFVRKFGNEGKSDGAMSLPCGLAVDDFGNMLITEQTTTRLQVFSPEGDLLISRDDLGLHENGISDVAWNSAGGLALVEDDAHSVRLWGFQ